MAGSLLEQYLSGNTLPAAPTQPASQAVPSSKAAEVSGAADRIVQNFAQTGNFPTLNGEIQRIDSDRAANTALVAQQSADTDKYGMASTANLQSANPLRRAIGLLDNVGNSAADTLNDLNTKAGNAGATLNKDFHTLMSDPSDREAFQRKTDRNNQIKAFQQNATDLQAQAAFEGNPGAYDQQAQQQLINAASVPALSQADQDRLSRTVRPFNYNGTASMQPTSVDAALTQLSQKNTISQDPATLANPVNQDALNADLESATQGKSGLNYLLSGLGAYARHPGAIAEQAGSSVPYMLGGVPGMVATSGLMGAGVAAEAQNAAQQRQGGALPTLGDMAYGTALGAADGGLNFAEAAINKAGLVGRSVGGKIAAPVTDALADSALSRGTSRLASALSTTPAGRIAAATLPGIASASGHALSNAATEAGVSALQNQIEGNWMQGNPEWDTEGNANAALQGGVLGGAFAAPGVASHAIHAGAKATAEAAQSESRAEAAKDTQAQNTNFDNATDINHPDSNPEMALRQQRLIIQDPQSTPEQQQEAQGKVDDYIGNLNTQADIAQTKINNIGKIQTALDSAKDTVKQAQQNVQGTQDSGDTNAHQAALSSLDAAQTRVATLSKGLKMFGTVPEHEATISKVNDALTAAAPEYTRIQNLVGASKESADARENNVDTATSPEATPDQQAQATNHIVSYPMQYTPDQLEHFVQNAPDNVPAAQVNAVSAVATAQRSIQAVKSPKLKTSTDVNADITSVRDGENISLPDYMDRMNRAISVGDTPTQVKLTGLLNKFNTRQTSKADVAQKALQTAIDTNKPQYIVPNSEGTSWEMAPEGKYTSAKQVQAAGGLQIHKNSNNTGLIDNMQSEATAISDTAKAVNAMSAAGSYRPANVRANPIEQARQSTSTPTAATSPDFTTPDSEGMSLNDYIEYANQGQPETTTTPAEAPAVTNPQAEPEGEVTQGAEAQPEFNPKPEQTFNPERQISSPQAGKLTDAELESHLSTIQDAMDNSDHPNLQRNFDLLNREYEKRQNKSERMAQSVDRPNRTVDSNLNTDQQTNTVIDEAQETAQQSTQIESTSDDSDNPDTEVVNAPEAALDSNPDVATTVDTNNKPDGQATVLDSGSRQEELDKPATERNLVRANFIQAARKGFPNPLVTIKDFMSKTLQPALASGTFTDVNRLLAKMIHNGHNSSEAQVAQLRHFNTFYKSFVPHLESIMDFKDTANRAAYKWQDYAQFLMSRGEDGKPTMDENTKAAIALAAYSHIIENAGNSQFKTRDTIAAQFGLQSADDVSAALYNLTKAVGDNPQMLAQSMGTKAYQALGFKLASKDVGINEANKMKMSLGAYALMSLEQAGLMTRTNIDSRAIDNAKSGLNSSDEKGHPVPFVKLATVTNSKGFPEITPYLKQVAQTSRNTGSLLTKLFSFDSGKVAPRTKIPTKFANTYGDFNAEIPDEARKYMTTMERQANGINETMATAFKAAMSSNHSQQFLRILGVKSPESMPYAHQDSLDSQDAKNRQIETSVNDALQFINSLKPDSTGRLQNYYLPYAMWGVQRVGVASNMFNPQGNKVHRILGGLRAFESIIDPTEGHTDSEGNPTRLAIAKAVIAQGMEEVPFSKYGLPDQKTIDKTNMLPYIEQSMDPYVQLPHVQDAISAMNDLTNGQVTRAGLDAIEHVVGEMGMGPQSLSALHSLAQLSKGEKTTLAIGGESDGITNGPMITRLLFGTGSVDSAAMGGMYPHDSKYNDMISYLNDGKDDLYVATGKVMGDELANIVPEYDAYRANTSGKPYQFKSPLGRVLGALQYLNPQFGDRKGAKPIVTKTNYGAGDASVRASMGDATVDALYSKHLPDLMQRIATKDSTAAQKAKEINTAIQRISGVQNFALPTTVDALRKYQLPKNINDAIYQAEAKTRGEASVQAVKRMSGDQEEANGKLQAITNVAYTIFNTIRTNRMAARLKELAAKGQVDTNAKGDPISGLTTNQMAELDAELAPYRPMISSAMGANSANKAESGYLSAKSGKSYGDQSKANMVQVKFAKDSKVGSFSAYPSISGLDAPGVAMGASTVQGTDAAVALRVSASGAYNFHDSNGMGIRSIVDGAKLQNQSLYEAVRDYDVGQAYEGALHSAVKGLMKYKSELSPEDVKAINDQITSYGSKFDDRFSKKNPMNLYQLLTHAAVFAVNTDSAKLALLGQLGKIGQYGFEGGTYTVPTKDSGDLDNKRKALVASRNDRIKAARSLLKGEASGPKAEIVNPETFADHMQALSSSGSTTVDKVLPLVQNHLTGGNKPSAVMAKELTKLLSGAVNKGMEVNFVTDSGNTGNVMDEANNLNSRAWYVPTKSGGQINIRLNGSQAVTPEVVLHEVLHGVTAHVLYDARTNSKAKPEVVQAAKNLDALLDHLKTKLATESEETQRKFQNAVQNTDELVSWGLTNPEFQQYLTGITGLPLNGRSKAALPSAMRNFITNVANAVYSFLGKKANPKTINGLEALMYDSAALVSNTHSATYFDGTSLPMAAAAGTVGKYTHKELFDSLLNTQGTRRNSPEFTQRLSTVMDQVADKLYSVIGGSQITGDSASNFTPGQVWNEAMTSGKAPYATKALGAGFAMTDQEAFAIEAVETTLAHTLNSGFTSPAMKELRKAWETSRRTVKVSDLHNGDWNTASQLEKDMAQAKWDHLFHATSPEYLAQFAAMAIAHEDTSKLLKFSANENLMKPTPGSHFEHVAKAINHAINWASGKLTDTIPGAAISGNMPSLARNLVAIQLKNMDKSTDQLSNLYAKTQDISAKASELFRTGIGKVGESQRIQKSPFSGVRLVGKLSKLHGEGNLSGLTETLQGFRDSMNKGQANGEIMSIIREATLPNATGRAMEKLFRYTNNLEQDRARLKAAQTSAVNGAFEDNGKNLTDEDRTALTYSLLRTDAQSLQHHFSMSEIHDIMGSALERNKAIKKMEQAVLADPDGVIKVSRAKALGFWLATGRATQDSMALNAEAIARHAGLAVDSNTAPEQGHIEDIDSLASLYAIRYTDSSMRNTAYAAMSHELARGTTNGIAMMLGSHAELSSNAKSTLFADNPMSAIKGYLPDQTNPYHDVKVMTESEAKQKGLESMGYQHVGIVPIDANVFGAQTRHMYVTKDSGYQRMVSGSISLTGDHRKGSGAVTGIPGAGLSKAAALLQTNQRVQQSFATTDHANFNPVDVKESKMVPVLGTSGEVVDYRYMMDHSLRDSLLDRNNNFAELLGNYAGQSMDKQTAPEQNNKVLDAMHADYEKNFRTNDESYMHIAANAPTERGREIWAMLPDSAKQYAATKWGNGQGMYIRNDLVNLTFGFKKYSIGEVFDKSPDDQNLAESLFQSIMTGMFGDKAKLRSMQGMRGIQELMGLFKDIVIVRNVSTLVGNLKANLALNTAYGVNPIDTFKWGSEALQGGLSYRKNMALLLKYQAMQRAGVGDFNELETRIQQAQDLIDRNPLKEFIEMGAMPTIIEDLNHEPKEYTYKSSIKAKLDPLTSKVPDSIKTAVNYATVGEGTPLYRFLNDATTFSDFMTKYAMYKHFTEKAKNRRSKDDAFDIASNAFVNFDMPASRMRQFADDIGLLVFSKYRIRIQRAIFHLMGENPAAAIGQSLLMSRFTNTESALAPNFLNNLGNPFKPSVLQLPGALMEPFPIQLMSAVM